MVDVLKGRGYRIFEARDGDEALNAAEKCAETIHLVLTDVVMPGMTGREMADRLKPLRPGIKVLYVSGYAEEVIAFRGVLTPGVAFIAKPFTPEALAQKVKELLTDRAAAAPPIVRDGGVTPSSDSPQAHSGRKSG